MAGSVDHLRAPRASRVAAPPRGPRGEPGLQILGLITTNDPTLRNAGPRRNRRHLRSDATLTFSRFETSCSVMRLTMIHLVECSHLIRKWQRHLGTVIFF